MPVRRKMKVVYQDAIQKVGGQWHHLFSEQVWRHPYATRWRWLGSRFGPRQLDGAGRNTEIPGGHAGILSHIDLMPLWPLILKLPKGPTSRRWELTCGRVFLLLFLVVGFLTLAAKCCAPSGMRQAVLVGDGAPAEEHRAGVVLTSSGDTQPRQTLQPLPWTAGRAQSGPFRVVPGCGKSGPGAPRFPRTADNGPPLLPAFR